MKRTIYILLLGFLSIGLVFSQDKTTVVKFKVSGVTCDHCVDEVKEALVNVKGVKSVEFEETNLNKGYGIVKVSYNPNQVSIDKLAEAVNETGFETDLKQEKKQPAKVEGAVAKINVKGIECGGCAKSVENSLKKVDGVRSC